MTTSPSDIDDELDLGPCCACEAPIARNMMLLDFEGPEGTAGWGCFVCNLPARGASALLCDECMTAGKEPRFVVGGRYAAEKVRVPIDAFERKPFVHDAAAHKRAEQIAAAQSMRPLDHRVLSHGEGVYDDLCTHVRNASDAESAFVIVINGNRGSGFSAQTHAPTDVLLKLPDLLESIAASVRRDVERLKN